MAQPDANAILMIGNRILIENFRRICVQHAESKRTHTPTPQKKRTLIEMENNIRWLSHFAEKKSNTANADSILSHTFIRVELQASIAFTFLWNKCAHTRTSIVNTLLITNRLRLNRNRMRYKRRTSWVLKCVRVCAKAAKSTTTRGMHTICYKDERGMNVKRLNSIETDWYFAHFLFIWWGRDR